jgi:hypothetical protein
MHAGFAHNSDALFARVQSLHGMSLLALYGTAHHAPHHEQVCVVKLAMAAAWRSSFADV